MGWVLTWQLAQRGFDPVSVTSLTFSGPSAGSLMVFLDRGNGPGFDIGPVPGVVPGAIPVPAIAGEPGFRRLSGESQMRRSITGPALAGFAAMLAGDCAPRLRADFAGRACAMRDGAAAAELVLDRRAERAPGRENAQPENGRRRQQP